MYFFLFTYFSFYSFLQYLSYLDSLQQVSFDLSSSKRVVNCFFISSSSQEPGNSLYEDISIVAYFFISCYCCRLFACLVFFLRGVLFLTIPKYAVIFSKKKKGTNNSKMKDKIRLVYFTQCHLSQ